MVAGTADDDVRKRVDDIISENGFTLETLSHHVSVKQTKELAAVDVLIDRQLKTIRQLQKSIHEAEARPKVMERLRLQVEQLSRDVNVLPHP